VAFQQTVTTLPILSIRPIMQSPEAARTASVAIARRSARSEGGMCIEIAQTSRRQRRVPRGRRAYALHSLATGLNAGPSSVIRTSASSRLRRDVTGGWTGLAGFSTSTFLSIGDGLSLERQVHSWLPQTLLHTGC
jgi:hypothetical protein